MNNCPIPRSRPGSKSVAFWACRHAAVANVLTFGRLEYPAFCDTGMSEPGDGVDAPRLHRCAIVEVLNTTEGGVRVRGYHDRVGYR